MHNNLPKLKRMHQQEGCLIVASQNSPCLYLCLLHLALLAALPLYPSKHNYWHHVWTRSETRRAWCSPQLCSQLSVYIFSVSCEWEDCNAMIVALTRHTSITTIYSLVYSRDSSFVVYKNKQFYKVLNIIFYGSSKSVSLACSKLPHTYFSKYYTKLKHLRMLVGNCAEACTQKHLYTKLNCIQHNRSQWVQLHQVQYIHIRPTSVNNTLITMSLYCLFSFYWKTMQNKSCGIQKDIHKEVMYI